MITSDKYEENKFIVDNIDDLLKGLFRILETDNNNAKTACLCLVNISAKESSLNKIMSFINNDISSNSLVYFIKNCKFFVINFNFSIEKPKLNEYYTVY